MNRPVRMLASTTMITLGPSITKHLLWALQGHTKELNARRIPVPPLLVELTREIANVVAICGQLPPPAVPPDDNDSRLTVNLRTAAEVCGISTSTLRRRLREGHLKPVGPGRTFRFRTDEVMALALKERTKW